MKTIRLKRLRALKPYKFIGSHSLIAGLVCLFVFWGSTFLILTRDREVILSYSGANCISDITLLPNFFKTSSEGTYNSKTSKPVRVHEYPLISRETCLQINKTPKENSKETASLGFLNLPLLKKNFIVAAGTHPRLNTNALKSDISVKSPLVFELDKSDSLFTYSLVVENKKTICETESKQVICPVEPLGLKQATSYKLSIDKKLGNDGKPRSIASSLVKTSNPVNVVETSIKDGQTVYDSPTEFKFTTDKTLASATVKLKQAPVTDSSKEILITSSVNGKEIVVKSSEVLARNTNYELVLVDAVGQDKGQLTNPYVVHFKLSGGPVVAAVNIGSYLVNPDSSFIITFDQQLDQAQDPSKLVSLSVGGNAASFSASVSGNRIIIKPSQRLPICSRFQIQLSNDVVSLYGFSGNSAWGYSSRVICHTISTIGYSTQGRPILAWRFGSGASKVIYVGNIHGNEKSAKYLMDSWIDAMNANPDKIPPGRTIIVVPSLNPDGFAVNSRRNARGIDLNRNFPSADWKSDVTMPGGQLVIGGAGASPLSEPESQALVNLINAENPRLVLAYHSVASIVSANGSADSSALAGVYSKLSGYSNVPANQTGEVFAYDTTGSFEAWIAEQKGIAEILVELGSNIYSEIGRNRDALWSMATIP